MDNKAIKSKYFIVDYTIKAPRKPFIQPLKHFKLMNDRAYQNKIKQEELDYIESLQDYYNNLEEFYLAQLQKYILNKEKYKVLNSIKEFDFSQIIENNCFWLQTNSNKEGQNYIMQFKHINCYGKQKQIKLNNIRFQENKVRGSSLSLRIVKFNSKEQKEQFSLFHFFSQKSQQKFQLAKAIKIQKNIQNQKFITPEQSCSSFENEDITQEDDIQSEERQMTPQFFNQHQIQDDDIEFYDSTTTIFDSSNKKRHNPSSKRDLQKNQKQNINQVEQRQGKNLIEDKNNIQLNNNKEVIMILDDNDQDKLTEIEQQNKSYFQLQYNSKADKNQTHQNSEQKISLKKQNINHEDNQNGFQKCFEKQQILRLNYVKRQDKQSKDQQIKLIEQQQQQQQQQQNMNKIQQNCKSNTISYSIYHKNEPAFIIIND
ncbi:hypothetical protein TTHERM_00170570 (macronuclear) [Tetrahymena thermophila SB210]|uniref:Uncharacterized protein n=1 Tax=Tetrahymena thermophila (strain SB210) TaxID=312017 RepID=Q22TG9_TETTS|nr:hypothetical protein TTHERM_00170570 [Tetrahymena thermophila SB210]EAR88469.4 hypothetical protein TTHERM_00170570 [Tetrahymena thermophila SB210]|eukprot:XP_001008714.4 hypothetical protein TTHERM_00170570 [Tetrahymena thermophila SB210]